MVQLYLVKLICVVFLIVPATPLAAVEPAPVEGQVELPPDGGPELLSYEELVELSATATPAAPLGERLSRLLHTPFVSNEAYRRGVQPHRPSPEGTGPLLRAAAWNIERGSEFDLIRLAFTDAAGFETEVAQRTEPASANPETFSDELAVLQGVDVLILNEVDLAMARTDYRDVARELAHSLDMNYAFAVEFVEVDPLDLGVEQVELADEELEQELRKELAVDQSRYRGLHGSAVLSRYALKSARVHRLKPCYDWYRKEKKAISDLEKSKRWGAERLFLERISRELRHGNRMALIVELLVPESPTGVVTVVAAHLENKCPPKCRRRQMAELLAALRNVEGPLLLGGDLNTTGTDAAPTSVSREISKRVKNPKFWAGQVIRRLNPVNIPSTLLLPSNYFKNYLDPTARHLPFVAPNREAQFFRTVEKFRFADGYAFDFRGDLDRSTGNRGGTLANSNQRAGKGFSPTFSLKRDYRGLVGRFKLDWFLVKPLIRHPRAANGSYWFAPHSPLTLQKLNEAVPGRISDHHPIVLDLHLTNPFLESSRSFQAPAGSGVVQD